MKTLWTLIKILFGIYPKGCGVDTSYHGRTLDQNEDIQKYSQDAFDEDMLVSMPKEASDAMKAFKTDSADCYASMKLSEAEYKKFMAGDQWSEEEMKAMSGERLFAVSEINKILKAKNKL